KDVRYGGKADMTVSASLLSRSLLGVKRTRRIAAHLFYDPKGTLCRPTLVRFSTRTQHGTAVRLLRRARVHRIEFGEAVDARVRDLYGVGKQQPLDGFGAGWCRQGARIAIVGEPRGQESVRVDSRVGLDGLTFM